MISIRNARRAAIGAATFLLAATSPSLAGETYSYDGAGRLTSIVYADSSSIAYAYDPNGNITSIVSGGPSAVREDGRFSTELRIDEISPNPTSGDAAVRFHLGRATRATLSVIDLVGREQIVSDGILQSGLHEASLRGIHLPGPYICVLRAAGRSDRRLVVMVR
jgi:YD repeat-containing protein